MRLLRRSSGCLACLAAAVLVSPVQAGTNPDPLRLIPDQADLVFKIEQPAKLVDVVYQHPLFEQFRRIEAVRELYDSTSFRRYYQLVAYFEKELGMKWPVIIEQVAGGGVVVAAKLGTDPGPAMLVIQSKNEQTLQKFFRLATKVIGQELARQESKQRLKKGKYQGIDSVRVGKDVYAAVVGSALLISNKDTAFKKGIDLHLHGGKKSMANLPAIAECRNTLPANPLAWAWINFDAIKKFPQAKTLLAEKQNDVLLTIGIGPYLDLARRSPFLCAGIYQKSNRLLTTIRFPRGLEGMPVKWRAFQPASGQMASLPLLEPKNVLASSSYYFDLSQYWVQRKELFNGPQVKTFEQFDKTSGRFLGGARFSKLTAMAGPYHRLVVAQQEKAGYKKQPRLLLPAGAFVISMRDPEGFTKTVGSLVRTGALLAGTQFGLKMVEEKRGDYKIVGYRFSEDQKKLPAALRNDKDNLRFNVSPCFVRVGDQFLVSSTMELARELVDILDKESKEPTKKQTTVESRTKVYASGGVALMKVFREQLLTQTILGQAVTSDEATKQVALLTDLVGKLGIFKLQQKYSKNRFQYDFIWQWAK